MKRLLQNRQRFRKNMILLIGMALTLYFSYHLIAGQRGYFKLKSLEYQISQTSQDLEKLTNERHDIEKKVVMMRPGSVDRDLLEERVRYMLGYTSQEEYILLHNRS